MLRHSKHSEPFFRSARCFLLVSRSRFIFREASMKECTQRTTPCARFDDRAAVLGDLGKVSSELVFFDDEKPIFVRLNQPEVMKPLHKQADPRPRRAHHLGQFFV